MMCGGLGASSEANQEVKNICNEIKDEVEHKQGRNFDVFIPLNFKQQVVAGTNYFIKIQVGDSDECLHIRVFKSLPVGGSKLQLHSIKEGQSVTSEIKYF